jgi:hypothetical protein
MNEADGTLYIIGDEGDDEWVSPEPADAVIRAAVTEATDLEADDLDDLDGYVERAALAAVIEGGDDEVTFDVEGHEVTVSGDGDVSVE